MAKKGSSLNGFTAQKVVSSIKNFFRKCDQIRFGYIYWKNP